MAAPLRKYISFPISLYKRFSRVIHELASGKRQFSDAINTESEKAFDESMLKFVACPLSKRPLRYDKENNELICDEIGIAYPIIDGIPNLIPQDARMLNKDKQTDEKEKT